MSGAAGWGKLAAVYRLVITVTAADAAAQATSSWAVYAPGQDVPFAYAAGVFGDADGAVAEAEGRAAAGRHARRRDEDAAAEAAAEVAAEVTVERRRIAARPVDAATSPALAALAALTDELDALQARAKAGFPDDVACQRGCAGCCHQHVGISRVEAARVEATIAGLAPEARAALAGTIARATAEDRGEGDVCGALDAEGGCQIYGGRPVVCRSHGLVYWRRAPAALLEFNRSCHLNYRGASPVPLLRVRLPVVTDVSMVYEVDAWAGRLRAIDGAYAAELGVDGSPVLDRSIRLNDLLARLIA